MLSVGGPNGYGLKTLIFEPSAPGAPQADDVPFYLQNSIEEPVLEVVGNFEQVIINSGILPVPPLGGGQDDGANISAILKLRDVLLVPGAVYNLGTPIVVTGLTRRKLIADNAILQGSMAQTGGNTNSLIYGNRILAPVQSTSIAVAPAFGQNKIQLTDASSMFPGSTIECNVDQSSGAIRQYFKILAKAVNLVTVDEPVLVPLVTSLAHTVFQVLNRPTDITISCEGTLFTGSGDRAISITGGKQIKIYGPATIDCSGPTNNVCLSGGVELFACSEFEVDEVYVNGFSAAANADVFDYGFRFISCVQGGSTNVQATNCTVANMITFDCTQCVFMMPQVYDSIAALATGLAIGGTAVPNPKGCLECDYYAVSAANFFNGWGMNIDRAARCNFFGYHGDNEGLLQFGFAHAEDLYFSSVTSTGSAAGAASGFNQGIIVGDGAHSGGFSKGSQIDDLTLIDCGSTVGSDNSTGDVESSITIHGFTQRNPTVPSTRGFTLSGFNASDTMRLTDVRIETCPTGTMSDGSIRIAGAIGAGATYRCFIERAVLTLNHANDVGITHVSSGILSVAILRDVEALNPGGVIPQSGYVGTANTAARFYGRVDFSQCSVPITANELNRGTFATNNNVAVNVTFHDINAQEEPRVWISTSAGTPAPDQTIVVTGGTGFAVTGKNLDTSTRAYEI